MFLFYALVTGVAAAYCLLAIWVACGRGHWFARACVLLAALALLVPIRAYEPLILFGMTSVLLVGGWGIGRALRTQRKENGGGVSSIQTSGYRLRLVDLLLACVVASAASWMISVLVAHDVTVTWSRAGGTALLLTSVASLAVQAVLYRGWWWRTALVLVALGVAGFTELIVLDAWSARSEMLDAFDPRISLRPAWYVITGFAVLHGIFASWCLLGATLAVGCVRTWSWKSISPAIRGTSILVGAAAFIFLGWVYVRMLDVPHYLVGRPDRENVLPRIHELGKNVEKASPVEAEVIFIELFSLLDLPSFVAWPENRPDEAQLDADPALRAGRQLMRRLKARRDQLVGEASYDEAADQCLAMLRLAPMLDREGIAIHRLEADAVRHYGHAWIAKGREQLSADKAREAARLIITIEAGREPIADTDLRDRMWHNQLTWRHVFKRIMFAELESRDLRSPLVRGAADMADRTQCFGRLLALDLLIRAHAAEHGAWPATLEEVTAGRNADLAVDPYSGQPFVYRRANSNFVLYSVGPDAMDDGGSFANSFRATSLKPGIDWDVDTMIRP